MDPEPAATLALQSEIVAAIENGAADYLPEGTHGSLAEIAVRCPWPGVLLAKGDVTIGGERLGTGDRFTLLVGRDGGAFRCRLARLPAGTMSGTPTAVPEARAPGLEATRARALRRGSRLARPTLGVGALGVPPATSSFRTHPCSPIPAGERSSFPGVPYFPYDAELRVRARVAPVEVTGTQIASSGAEAIAFDHIATARL